jgi:hypothetical protein
MHDAENVGDEPSLHITVGLITKTWADLLLESISELALSEPDFRRSLPAGFSAREFDREVARRHFNHLTRLIADKASMDSAFDLLADNFIRARRPNVSGVVASAQALAAGDRFRRRRFVPWNVADDEGKLILIGPGGDLEFNASRRRCARPWPCRGRCSRRRTCRARSRRDLSGRSGRPAISSGLAP